MTSQIILLARNPRPRWRVPVAVAFVLATVLGGLVDAVSPAAAATGSITGRVFEDVDRDGVFGGDDAPWSGYTLWVFGPDGSYVTAAGSGDDGTYSVSDLPAGSYRIRLSNSSWDPIKYDWTPTTTTTLQPEATVEVGDGAATFHLGWRRITISTDPYAPLSEAVSDDGVTVQSFNDALHATQVLEALDEGTLRGGEAATTTVRFGYGSTTACTTSISGAPGTYGNFSARCSVSFKDWLSTGDRALHHEYGHSWARYHEYVVQQDNTFSSYLEFRGLTGDPRLGSTHSWQPGEMIAEDFRQLFGSPTAAAYPQANREIVEAADVPGLREWLSQTFMEGDVASEPTVEPSPEPTSDPTAEPSPEPTTEPTELSLANVDASDIGAETTIVGTVSKPASVRAVITASNGREIATVVLDEQADGDFVLRWDETDSRGRPVKDGTYDVTAVATDGTKSVSVTVGVNVDTSGGDGGGSGGTGKGQGKGGPA